MEKIPTAEEMFDANPILPKGIKRQACIVFMKQFAKMHVEQALKEASEKVVLTDEVCEVLQEHWFEEYIDKNSILNSYSLDNIK